jgi:hypothetical protein
MSKYRNVPVSVDGERFDSKKEARRYCDLVLLQRAGEIRNLQRQVPLVIDVNGQRVCEYRADFEYDERQPDGSWARVTEDVKGVRTALYGLKAKLVKAVHGITIRET